jgi:predicted alpha/beta hydrolase family esterase
MKTSDVDLLIVPGLHGSEDDHWQSRWASKLSTARKIKQKNWAAPQLDDWVKALHDAIIACQKPIVLIGHSLGVPTIAHTIARHQPRSILGAFLVAPPSESATRVIESIDAAFTPYPTMRFPFKTLLIASQNDPFSRYDEAAALAQKWGAELTDAGEAGHINSASGHGPWPEGLMRLAGFLKTLG